MVAVDVAAPEVRRLRADEVPDAGAEQDRPFATVAADRAPQIVTKDADSGTVDTLGD